MNKLIIFLTMSLMMVGTLQAQRYFRLGAGYGTNLGGMYIDENITGTPSVLNYEGVYGSFGNGINLSGALGLPLAEHVTGEIALGYKLESTHEATGNVSDAGSSFSATASATYKGSMFTVTPSIVLSADVAGISPYARMGAVLAMPKMQRDFQSSSLNNGSRTSDQRTDEYSGNLAWGLAGGAGVIFGASSSLRIFTEVNFANLTWEPDQDHYTKSGTNGTDSQTIKYSESRKSTDVNTAIPPAIAFGHVGLTAGLMFMF